MSDFVFTIVLVMLVSAAAGAQQYVRGTVLDEATGEPVSDVQLHLVDPNGLQVSQVSRTDNTGRFVLRTTVLYRVSIRAVRIGYAPTTTPAFVIPEGQDYTVELLMSRRAQVIAPLKIIAAVDPSRGTMIDGFEYRRTRGLGGYYMSKEEIESKGAGEFVDLLRGIAGVRVTGNDIEMVRRSNFRDTSCVPAFYMNGMPLRGDLPEIFEALNNIDFGNIHGLEVYRGVGQVPAEFSGTDAACGVVVVWTRRGGS